MRFDRSKLFARSPLGDPAMDAARLLQWLAFVLLVIIAPVSEALSAGLLYILFPVGAAIVIIAGLLTDGAQVPRRAIGAFINPIGAAVAFLSFWSAMSFLWTFAPDVAAAQLMRTLLTAGVALLAIASLPERTKISNVYLLPIGVLLSAVVTLALIVFGPNSFRLGADPDHVLAQRCIMSLAILLWPALGALALRERFVMAAALVALVAATTLANFVQIALAALMLAALTYAAAMTDPRRVARIVVACFVVVLIGFPILVAVAYPVIKATPPLAGSAIGVFSDLVVHDWLRFITGHGLNMVERSVELRLLPQNTPRSIIFTLWYELGIVGVAGFAFMLASVTLSVDRLPPHAAPAFLAIVVAGLVIAIFGAETIQLWWVTLNGVAAVALALVVKARPASKRPRAPGAPDEIATEDAFEAYEA